MSTKKVPWANATFVSFVSFCCFFCPLCASVPLCETFVGMKIIALARPVLLSFLLTVIVASDLLAQHDPLRLTHGPMLGNSTAHSMSVWGRTSEPGQFSVRYGTDASRLDQTSQ